MKKENVTKEIKVGTVRIGGNNGFALIAGPCVIESESSVLRHARILRDITDKLKIPFIFKVSYDKANRSSLNSYRGPGLRKGLKILEKVKKNVKVPITSDVHNVDEVEQAARVLDLVQIPAFLSRQTDVLLAAGRAGKAVNIKKGQFLAPWDMENIIKKVKSTGNANIMVTERGTMFGYNNLVSDFRSIIIMRELGYPVCYDATHSVQKPGGLGDKSGGDSKFVPVLAQAALVAGIDALFIEVHENPEVALSDGPNMMKLSELKPLLMRLKEIENVIR